MRSAVDTLRCGFSVIRMRFKISSPPLFLLLPAGAQVFAAKGLDGALSSFLCFLCFCFVASCCWFFLLSFLPPLSPMPFSFVS